MQQRYDERDLYTGLASVHWATISVTDPLNAEHTDMVFVATKPAG